MVNEPSVFEPLNSTVYPYQSICHRADWPESGLFGHSGGSIFKHVVEQQEQNVASDQDLYYLHLHLL